jgi:hypothetical protein
MQILLNTDNSIDGTLDLSARVEGEVRRALAHYEERLTRVEVHLKDVNGHKGGDDDIACTMEARPRNHPPVAVTQHGGNLDLAVANAAEALSTALGRRFGKLDDRV